MKLIMMIVEVFCVKMVVCVKMEWCYIGRFCYDMSVEVVGYKCGLL